MNRARIAKLTELALVGCLGLFFLSVAQAEESRNLVDETGRVVALPTHPQRVISLAPNLTEILFALGLEDKVVGVTDACDFPAAARRLPRVGSIISPNLETIVSLHPDLLLATTAGNRRETVAALERLGLPVYATNPHSLATTLASIRHIATLLNVEERGQVLVEGIEARLKQIQQHSRSRRQPTVLFVVWFEPIVTAGKHTFIQDAIQLAGGESVSSEMREDWPRLSLEEVVRHDPDIILTAQAPGMEQRLREILRQPGWRELKAVRTGRVLVLDDKALRPGPRLMDVIAEMAQAFYPEAFR